MNTRRITLMTIVILLLTSAGCGTPIPPPPTNSTATPKFDRSPEKQAQRQALIQKATDQGYIKLLRKTDRGIPIYAVNRDFMDADVGTKQNIASVIYLLYFDGSNVTERVEFVDTSGKNYGSYSPDLGLRLR